ncbi:MAG: hypothetical protein ACOCQD_05355 [archaeon]
MKQDKALRFATMLYTLENDTTFKGSLNSVIEDIFISYNNQPMTVHELIELLRSDEGLNMTFSSEEIIDTCKTYDNSYIIEGSKDEEIIKLSTQRYNHLCKRQKKIKLSDFINKFYDNYLSEKYKTKFSFDRISKIIHVFIFRSTVESQEEYRKMLSLDEEKPAIDKVKSNGLLNDADAKNIINEFISWEDEKKNKLLYSFYNIGLHFAILSSKKDLVSKNIFDKTVLYLDTNILFRVLGFNGDELKKQNIEILQKMKRENVIFKISKITNDEFYNTIREKFDFMKYHMVHVKEDKISKYFNMEFSTSFYDYFRKWRTQKENGKTHQIRMFLPHVESQLKRFIASYDVVVEERIPKSKIDNQEIDKFVDEYIEMTTYNKKPKSVIKSDMKNYSYLLHLNDQKKKNDINKIFFLTNDYKLINFDLKQNDTPMIVIHPARLYSLYLKVAGRLNESDLMSFTNLLQIDFNECPISEETYQILNDYANFYEEDDEIKDEVIESLLNGQLAKDLDKVSDPMVIREKVKELFELKYSEKYHREQNKNVNLIKLNNIYKYSLLIIIGIIITYIIFKILPIDYIYSLSIAILSGVISSVIGNFIINKMQSKDSSD